MKPLQHSWDDQYLKQAWRATVFVEFQVWLNIPDELACVRFYLHFVYLYFC